MTNKSTITKQDPFDREAIHARVELVAHELGLTPAEIPGPKARDHTLRAFVYRHHLSFDWLCEGDLQGRMRMARWRSARRMAGG